MKSIPIFFVGRGCGLTGLEAPIFCIRAFWPRLQALQACRAPRVLPRPRSCQNRGETQAHSLLRPQAARGGQCKSRSRTGICDCDEESSRHFSWSARQFWIQVFANAISATGVSRLPVTFHFCRAALSFLQLSDPNACAHGNPRPLHTRCRGYIDIAVDLIGKRA